MKIHIKHFYLESNLYLFLDLQYIKIMKSLKVNLIRLARDLWYFILQYYTLQCLISRDSSLASLQFIVFISML